MEIKDIKQRYMKKNTVKLDEAQLRKIVAESVKNFDPANIVSQELAEKLGFKPEYKSYEDGLELWGKWLDFDPYDEYSGKTKKLLDELGIKEFTSWSRSVRGNSGHVRITVKPKPKSDAQYFYPKPIVPELYENTRKKNTVKLNESQLKKIVVKSVNEVLNEISDRTLTTSLETSYDYTRILEEVDEKFEDLEYALSDLAGDGYNNVKPLNSEAKSIYNELKALHNRFKQFNERKRNQYGSFEDEWLKRGQPEVD